MRHTEVTKTPGKCRNNRECWEGARRVRFGIIALEHIEITAEPLGIFNNSIHTPCLINTEYKHDQKSDCHNNWLNKVGNWCCIKATQWGVTNNNDCRYNHCYMIINTKKCTKQFTAGCKTGSGIRHEENNNHYSGNCHKNSAVISVSAWKIIRNCDCTDFCRIIS